MDFFSKLNQEYLNNFFSASQWSVLINSKIIENGFLGFLTEKREKKIDETTFFDLASLTKPLFTATVFYYLFYKQEIDFNDKISKFLPIKKDISILKLLNHTSGLPPYIPFFEQIKNTSEKKLKIITKIENCSLKKGKIYSDLNFILLGFILEKIFNTNLKSIYQEFLIQTKINTKINFANPPLLPNKAVATMFSKTRNKVLQGEVEDENAFFLNKEAGHAGLFGNALEIAKYINKLLNKDWFCHFLDKLDGAGFDRADTADSNYGTKANSKSLGHLGFTGTAFFFNTKQKKISVFLTNRTHPTPQKPNSKQRIKQLRQLFFDTFFN